MPAMTHRPVLAADKVSSEVHSLISSFHRNIVDEVAAAVTKNPVVVVGMAQNPVVKAARKLLDEEGVKYTYLEYGSYFSQWKERLASRARSRLRSNGPCQCIRRARFATRLLHSSQFTMGGYAPHTPRDQRIEGLAHGGVWGA
jgi:hypothetical protein